MPWQPNHQKLRPLGVSLLPKNYFWMYGLDLLFIYLWIPMRTQSPFPMELMTFPSTLTEAEFTLWRTAFIFILLEVIGTVFKLKKKETILRTYLNYKRVTECMTLNQCQLKYALLGIYSVKVKMAIWAYNVEKLNCTRHGAIHNWWGFLFFIIEFQNVFFFQVSKWKCLLTELREIYKKTTDGMNK